VKLHSTPLLVALQEVAAAGSVRALATPLEAIVSGPGPQSVATMVTGLMVSLYWTVCDAGVIEVICGRSFTSTPNEQDRELPVQSVDVQVTVVSPTGKVSPVGLTEPPA